MSYAGIILLVLLGFCGGLFGIKCADYFFARQAKEQIANYVPVKNTFHEQPDARAKEYALSQPIERLEYKLMDIAFKYRGEQHPVFTKIEPIESIIKGLSMKLGVAPVWTRIVEVDDPDAVPCFLTRNGIAAIILTNSCTLQDILHEYAHYLHFLENTGELTHGPDYIKHLRVAYQTYKEVFIFNMCFGES